MESDQRNHSKVLRGLFVGGVLGATAGFLLAPKSGKELRSDIKASTNKALDEIMRLCSDGRTRFENAFASISGRREGASVRKIESPEEIMAEA
jgi:gas vesicle protein